MPETGDETERLEVGVGGIKLATSPSLTFKLPLIANTGNKPQ